MKTRSCRLATLSIAASLFVSGMATAQPSNCGDRTRIVERLATKYGESRQSIGLGSNNQVMEVFASDDTGTWTITVTRPDGVTCLVASGNAFEAVEEATIRKGELRL